MNATIRRQLAARKRRIARRIENQPGVEGQRPMMAASNIHYEFALRDRGIAHGGIGAIHLLARRSGLIEAIDEMREQRHLIEGRSDLGGERPAEFTAAVCVCITIAQVLGE